jgi:hypothetical protein
MPWLGIAQPRRACRNLGKQPVTVVDFATLQAADWDLDRDADLLVGGMIQSQHRGLKLMLNNGAGTNWTGVRHPNHGSYSAETGDIDNDGDLDIVGIRNWNSAPTYIYRNNAGGGPSLDFWFHCQVSGAHVRTFGLCFPDVDGDGDLDVASGPFAYLNPGPPLTNTWTQVALPNGVHAFANLDVDGDPVVDLIAQKDNVRPTVELLVKKTGISSRTPRAEPILIGHVPRSNMSKVFKVIAWRIVASGRPEMPSPRCRAFYFAQNRILPRAGRELIRRNSDKVGVADIDADGDLDISFTSGASKQVKWARNPGDGSANWNVFAIGPFPEADWPDRCDAADLNGDGRVDIVATEENSGKAADALACWWEQPASGATNANWTRHTIATQFTMNNLDLADVDKDGDIDLVLAEHRGPKRIGIWENNGRGLFAEASGGRPRKPSGRAAGRSRRRRRPDLVSIAYDDFKRCTFGATTAEAAGNRRVTDQPADWGVVKALLAMGPGTEPFSWRTAIRVRYRPSVSSTATKTTSLWIF